MARISLVMAYNHSPFLFASPEDWNLIRERKLPVRADVPLDSEEINNSKFQRCMKALAILKEKIEAVRPDVLLIVSNDQLEQFDFNNYPALWIYLGDVVEGNLENRYLQRFMGKDYAPITGHKWIRAKGHPVLGKELLIGLMKRGFDPSFSLELPRKELGMPHGYIQANFYLTPRFDIPILPFHVNGFYSPQPSGKRCYELGKAIRSVIEDSSMDLNVAVLGSGGLWHTPSIPNAYLDEEFNDAILQRVGSGDARGLAEYYDSVPWPYPSASPEVAAKLVSGIGIPVGPGSGAGESRCWLVAAAVADRVKGTVVDNVPIYASPTGAAFAYWDYLDAQ
jgi:Catalytic LigB subunit of aromatic ring-opening dioxygenase